MTDIGLVKLCAGIALAAVGFIGMISSRAAYRNGCCDGYGYSREPWNPGYQEAGRYLRRWMAHRWSELERSVPSAEVKDGT